MRLRPEDWRVTPSTTRCPVDGALVHRHARRILTYWSNTGHFYAVNQVQVTCSRCPWNDTWYDKGEIE